MVVDSTLNVSNIRTCDIFASVLFSSIPEHLS